MAPPFPGAFAKVRDLTAFFWETRLDETPPRYPDRAPCLYAEPDGWYVDCVDRRRLRVTRLALDGRALSLRELHKLLSEKLNLTSAKTPESMPHDVQVRFAEHDAVRLRFHEGHAKLTLRLAEVSHETDHWRNFEVYVFYRPDFSVPGGQLLRDGVVQLNGFVDSAAERSKAESVAGNVNGVKQVRNNLQVGGEKTTVAEAVDDSVVTGKVKAAIAGDSALSGMQVNVETHEGTVLLSGFVDNPEQKTRAAEVARGVSGVRAVKNDTEVKRKAYP